MRSSIACVRCRRSKVKCVNNGVGTTCRACENSGRECSYPPPVPPGSRSRDSLIASVPRPDGSLAEPERRQRSRKSLATHTNVLPSPLVRQRDSPRPLLDALDPRLLTPAVWQELFDIFQIHFSADLPFLHPPTFLKPLRANPAPPVSNATTPPVVRPPGSNEFLLAFLALTARFHPTLVAHHSPAASSRESSPLIASEYYATAANEIMVSAWTENRGHDIEATQAALMLGLHEWGMCRGAKAWLLVGMAIRAAQAMGLQYENDLDDEPLSRSLILSLEADQMGVKLEPTSSSQRYGGRPSGDDFVQQEVRRRTFWSCFIMDRYLSSGKYRPQMLHARELRIQLPASEQSFLFGDKVRTLMLGEEDEQTPCRNDVQNQRQASVRLVGTGIEANSHAPQMNGHYTKSEEEKGRLETGSEEGLVSRYIKILEIYGKVLRFSCAGGRRVQEHPPWDERCEWHKLRQECLAFKASLPRQHTLSPQNTQAHISLKTSTTYVLVHIVYLLCQIMLNREYIPFLPLRCNKPEGPLDSPTFPPERYSVPPGFWADSARECFKSARDIIDLVRSCSEWNALVETPIVGFAIYTVAFIGTYCINFPWMDPEGYMCSGVPNKDEPSQRSSQGSEAAKEAVELIARMATHLKMAIGWFRTISRVHRYMARIKRDYKKNIHAIESGSAQSDGSNRALSLREGGLGGGLDEYKLLERILKEFGDLDDHDVEMTDDIPRASNMYEEHSRSGTSVKSEEADHRRSDGGVWNAINTAAGTPSTSTPNSAQFRAYDAQLNNFRPAESAGSYASSGAPPTQASPRSHAAATSHSSPPFERQNASSHGWTAQNASPYPMPPSGQSMVSGIPYYQPPGPPQQQSTPAYSPPAVPSAPAQGHGQYGAAMDTTQVPWSAAQRDEWLNSLNTQLGADDLAAFCAGGDVGQYAISIAGGQFGGGWLSTVWAQHQGGMN